MFTACAGGETVQEPEQSGTIYDEAGNIAYGAMMPLYLR